MTENTRLIEEARKVIVEIREVVDIGLHSSRTTDALLDESLGLAQRLANALEQAEAENERLKEAHRAARVALLTLSKVHEAEKARLAEAIALLPGDARSTQDFLTKIEGTL